jgi:hypothetical protein
MRAMKNAVFDTQGDFFYEIHGVWFLPTGAAWTNLEIG